MTSVRLLLVACLNLLTGIPREVQAAEPRSVQRIEDFEGNAGRQMKPITFWRWSAEEKQSAAQYSRMELTPEGVGKALKVSITRPLPKGPEFYPLWLTDLQYLTPETEAIRMRVKVVSGRFRMTVGGPTTYFATSDVRARPQVLDAGDWRTVEFSLISSLERNYRRPIFSQEAPVIYYTRWIQEPIRLMMSADSQGELLLDDIELLSRGVGRPFPIFPASAVRVVSAADPNEHFTFATDDREFDLSHTPGKEALRKPAVLSALTQGARGKWTARQRGAEEMAFFGLKARCPETANAVRITLKMEHQSGLNELTFDVLALVAPGGEFPWEKTRGGITNKSSSDSGGPGTKGFDYCLSPARTKGISWGFYHARRAVPKGEWTEVVIPFADFVCAHGSGELKERHQRQQPLATEEIAGVALVSPWRQKDADTVFTFEKIEFVTVPGVSGDHISYPQVPDVSKIRLEMKPGEYGRQASQVDTP